MLSDHAWNGTDLKNRRHNAELRRRWAAGLGEISQGLRHQAWQALGLKESGQIITVFNPLSFTNDILVECKVSEETQGVSANGQAVPAQLLENNNGKFIAFVAPRFRLSGSRNSSLPSWEHPRGIAA
jgi:hypothetical protein